MQSNLDTSIIKAKDNSKQKH